MDGDFHAVKFNLSENRPMFFYFMLVYEFIIFCLVYANDPVMLHLAQI